MLARVIRKRQKVAAVKEWIKTPIKGQYSCTIVSVWADAEGGGGRGSEAPPPPEKKKQKKYRVFSKTGPVPLKNLKATKPAFNVGPSGPKMATAYSGIWIISSTKKTLSKLDPL